MRKAFTVALDTFSKFLLIRELLYATTREIVDEEMGLVTGPEEVYIPHRPASFGLRLNWSVFLIQQN